MRVGVYVDGFNLYFGARSVCGRGTRGWRWLDLRALGERVIPLPWLDRGAYVERVVYCTARVSGVEDRTSPADQEVYLRALRAHGSVDRIALARARWPVQVRRSDGSDVPGALFMVSNLDREEKATDVNLATHLLVDVLDEKVDAAVVISNDSDLELPLRVARDRVPVGLLNPGPGPLAGRLRGHAAEGACGHWWRRIDADDYRASQLPDVVGPLVCPAGW